MSVSNMFLMRSIVILMVLIIAWMAQYFVKLQGAQQQQQSKKPDKLCTLSQHNLLMISALPLRDLCVEAAMTDTLYEILHTCLTDSTGCASRWQIAAAAQTNGHELSTKQKQFLYSISMHQSRL